MDLVRVQLAHTLRGMGEPATVAVMELALVLSNRENGFSRFVALQALARLLATSISMPFAPAPRIEPGGAESP